MKIKRVLQGTALTALAAAAWMGAGSTDASAEVVPMNDVMFDGEKLFIQAEESDHEIMVGVAKVSNDKAKVSAWDVYEYEDGYVEVDLSKLNAGNDNYIAVKTDDMSQPFFVKIAAASKQTKVTVDKATAKIKEIKTKVGKAGASAVDLKKTAIEWRTAIGGGYNSEDNAEVDFSQYQYQGATIYVRTPAVCSGIAKDTKTLGNGDDKKDTTTKYDVYTVGSLPGKEGKVSIAKQANGPKVAVDYAKGTVKLPKGTFYRVVTENEGIVTGGAVGDSKATPVADILSATYGENKTPLTGDKAVVEVRKEATDKKCASKWTRVEIQKPVAMTADGTTFNKDWTTKVTTAQAVNVVTTGASLTAQYTESKGKTKTINGLVLTNNSPLNLEYAVSTTASGIKKLATGGKKVTLKTTAASQNIYIRVAGDKKSKKWAGAWLDLGKVDFK